MWKEIIAVHGWYLLLKRDLRVLCTLFVTVPQMFQSSFAKHKELSSNFVILPFKVAQPQLCFVRTILVGFSATAELNFPAFGDHLTTHFAGGGSTQGHVRKVGVTHRLLGDLAFINSESGRQVSFSLLDCLFFCHVFADVSQLKSVLIQTTRKHSLFPASLVPILRRKPRESKLSRER